jgi:predicted regulator of Ras-like GTPase activity (Roadblock/LC7/MglB family)
MVKEKKNIQELTATGAPVTVETTTESSLRTSLQEISNYDGVIGYILRNTTSASIDLKDPTKIIEYAILSSIALDTSKDLSELLDLGDIKSTTVNGKNAKMLCMTIDENRISIFITKNADAEKILRKMRIL